MRRGKGKEVSSQNNPALNGIVKALRYMREKSVTKVGLTFIPPLRHLMPKKLEPYFRYQGSLTTPPCSEAVTWTVLWDSCWISEAELFNSFRSSVAVGNWKPFPSAANMLKLEWDNELATLAYLHSAFLINTSNWPLHDEVENRFTTRFKETGQSVAVFHNTTNRYVSYWNTVIREWFAEYQLMKLAAVGSYDADESTTNVSQMWWATTKSVGCGYSTMLMPNGHDFDHAYVCNFGPAGNVRGHAIYRQGATCSACPKETRCEPTTGLCSVVDEPRSCRTTRAR
ncbi:hypothetical protein MTO96_035153 [Rhipicephalus appendiculatus]